MKDCTWTGARLTGAEVVVVVKVGPADVFTKDGALPKRPASNELPKVRAGIVLRADATGVLGVRVFETGVPGGPGAGTALRRPGCNGGCADGGLGGCPDALC